MTDIISTENTYVFLPLYNIFIDHRFRSKILNKNILGYSISSIEFLRSNLNFLEGSLLENILDNPYLNKYSYLIYKKHIPLSKGKQNLDSIFSIEDVFERIILALRIYKSGMFCCENCFFFFPNMKSGNNILYTEVPFFPRFGRELNINELFGLQYSINSLEEIREIKKIYKKININWDDMKVAFLYFNKYYAAKENYDKILYLSIVLENLILPDNPTNIATTLAQRIAYLLDDINLIEEITKFYKNRSKIVHNGFIEERINDIHYIKKIEEIVRKIIKKILFHGKRKDFIMEYKYNTKIGFKQIFEKKSDTNFKYKKIKLREFEKIVQHVVKYTRNEELKEEFKSNLKFAENNDINYIEYQDDCNVITMYKNI